MAVRTSDLQITKETATGVDATGQYQLRDLVNISYVVLEFIEKYFSKSSFFLFFFNNL